MAFAMELSLRVTLLPGWAEPPLPVLLGGDCPCSGMMLGDVVSKGRLGPLGEGLGPLGAPPWRGLVLLHAGCKLHP